MELVDRSTTLMYQTEYEVIARKSREILWFKGYYDLISLGKRLWKKNDDKLIDRIEIEGLMSNLIIEGIANFKSIIVQLEQKYQLDLRHIVDFSFLDTYEKNLTIHYSNGGNAIGLVVPTGEEIAVVENGHRGPYSPEEIKYAMETIHALLISLGDLHRYFIDFNFNMPKISKDFAANYYFEAFKLSPKTGMAHNQLGTLFTGQNYDLDSIYHYLYSLVCPVPFELSDINVVKLLQCNSEYLEQLERNDKYDMVAVRDIISRYILIVDVFFFDKDIADFNTLCHCMLIDFRKMLQSKRMELSSDVIYKMTAILFFCLAKLKMLGSAKVHHLHAFLVAICSEMIAAFIMKLEQFIADRKDANDKFQTAYGRRFEDFERNVRMARDNHKKFLEEKPAGPNETNGQSVKILDHKLSGESTDQKVGTRSDGDLAGGSSGRERESDVKLSASSQGKNRKKQLKIRRRRKRVASDDSDSEMSDNEDSELDYEMDTDFSSESSSDEEDSWNSSDGEAHFGELNGTARQKVCLTIRGNFFRRKLMVFSLFPFSRISMEMPRTPPRTKTL